MECRTTAATDFSCPATWRAQVLIYGDCAVNVHPSSGELAQIAVTSADTAAAFGVEPRVALLSYSTFGSGTGPEVDRVRRKEGMLQSARMAPPEPVLAENPF